MKKITFFTLLFMLIGIYMLSPNLLGSSNSKLSIMTFNIENGGRQVDFDKVIEAIKKSDADVVGIQEAWGNTVALAKALGWKYYNAQQHIISRYPLFLPENDKGLFTFIELKPGKMVALANIHLPSDPYGPDLVMNHLDAEKIVANEKKIRLPTAIPFINEISALLKQHIPVFITGDFNSPSHLDWTEATVDKLPGHRYTVEWPITKMIGDIGLVDSLRAIYPDPLKKSAYSWPAGRPVLENAIDGFNPSKQDLPVRIDFIFSGSAKVLESHLVAEPEYTMSDIHVTPWPSDHRAFVSRFDVVPVSAPVKVNEILNLSSNIQASIHAPSSVKSGQDIVISWDQAPGNRFDYIRIMPANSKKLGWEDVVRLYTNGTSKGTIQYNKTNIAGNRPAWCKFTDAQWPLKPGIYRVSLMLDDSLTELASTNLVIR